jgi:heavy metal efflux system protein
MVIGLGLYNLPQKKFPGMKVYFSIIMLICFYFPYLTAQDTIRVDIEGAVKIALDNNAFRFDKNNMPNSNMVYSLPPTEIMSEYGQLYSPENGLKVEINQDFGPVFGVKGIHKYVASFSDYQHNMKLFQIKKFEIEIKSAFMEWLYYINLLDYLNTEQEYTLKSISVENLKVELGENELLDNVLNEFQASGSETELIECEYNIDIAENKLRKLLNTKFHIRPRRTVLEMYMIQKTDDTSAFNGNYKNDLILDEYEMKNAEMVVEKSKLAPQFQAGVFYQNFPSYGNMAGIQAGMRIPLWNTPVKNKIKDVKTQSEKLLSEYKSAELRSDLEIENLILELDKLFIRIRHFQNHALPAANMLLSTASVKYQKEDIEFEEYLAMVNQAMDIKKDYLQLVYQYNLTALQLELYTK